MDRRNVLQRLTSGAAIGGIAAMTMVAATKDANAATSTENAAINDPGEIKLNEISTKALPASKVSSLETVSAPEPSTLERGQSPLQRDVEKWQETVQNFYSLYGPVP